uniref:Protein kinase domain-containing protein n=1 Tax=Angiostrongylus cantonensis TaxID=6313 RepID=A0A0K0DRG0_ANGCA
MTDEKATEKPTQDMPKTNKDAIRSKTATYEILKHEAKVFKCMSKLNSPHFISLEDRGKVSGRFMFLILRLVDIKPTNFVIGREQDGDLHTIFIIDFGSSRRYRTIDKDLRYQREKVAFRGTTQYASVSALEMEEQSRKDDIESWWYMVLEWMIGKLPWRHYKSRERDEVRQRKRELREPGNLMTLLMDTPQTYSANILLYIDTLEYASIPDYNHIAAQLSASMKAYHLHYDDPPDWDTRGSYIGPRYEDATSYVNK